MSLWEDSCLTLGVTMAGCGMPVVCKLWWGGTMCGGNLEDRRLCKSSEWTQVKWEDGAHVYTRLKVLNSIPIPSIACQSGCCCFFRFLSKKWNWILVTRKDINAHTKTSTYKISRADSCVILLKQLGEILPLKMSVRSMSNPLIWLQNPARTAIHFT